MERNSSTLRLKRIARLYNQLNASFMKRIFYWLAWLLVPFVVSLVASSLTYSGNCYEFGFLRFFGGSDHSIPCSYFKYYIQTFFVMHIPAIDVPFLTVFVSLTVLFILGRLIVRFMTS